MRPSCTLRIRLLWHAMRGSADLWACQTSQAALARMTRSVEASYHLQVQAVLVGHRSGGGANCAQIHAHL